jgi:hypothetical protein
MKNSENVFAGSRKKARNKMQNATCTYDTINLVSRDNGVSTAMKICSSNNKLKR